MIAATVLLWLLVWGGMFTGIYNVHWAAMTSSPLAFVQGARAFAPLAAAYACVLWVLLKRPRPSALRNPLGFLTAYAAIGILSSMFLSVQKRDSIYWVSMFLAPLLVTWFALDKGDARRHVRALLSINYVISFLMTFSLLPEAFRIGWGRLPLLQQYTLPLGLGTIRTNGAGRFALIVIIVSGVRFLSGRSRSRLLWLAAAAPSLFLLTQTQSRTALLGLAVASVLFVYLRGLDWRLMMAGPVAAGAIYISAFRWRTGGQLDKLVALTGREYTWRRGLERVLDSPFLGWGFNADRLLLRSEHMHNSYLHAAIHTGLAGMLMFAAAVVGLWVLVFRSGLPARLRFGREAADPWVLESLMILGFLTARSLFESTAAFYGVDLLLFVPAVAALVLATSPPSGAEAPEAPGEAAP